MKKPVEIFRKTLILFAILIGLSLLGGYIYLRIISRGNEMIFIPPSQRYIEKTFIEKYGKELEDIAEFVLTQEEVYWDAVYPASLEVNGKNEKATNIFPKIEELYKAGLDCVYAIGEDNVQFIIWSDYIAYTSGFIYSKTGECGISGKSNVVFERFGDTNWYFFTYANDL